MGKSRESGDIGGFDRINDNAGIDTGGIDVVVYRSARRGDIYIIMPTADDFESLPEALRSQFGEATAFLEFHLHSQKTLAQADADAVLAALAEQGFYLQMPPADD